MCCRGTGHHPKEMRNLWAFLQKYHHWFLFLILEVVSAVLLFRFNSYQGSVFVSSANTMTGKVYELNSQIETFFSLTTINEQLTQRNVYLERQVKLLSDNLAELTRDSNFTQNSQLRLLEEYKLIPAKVVTNSLDKKDNFMTLDKGSADGVRRDMGVVCGTGLVGIVYLVSAHYSIVIPVLNSHSNLSVAISGKDYFGYLRWKGGASDTAYVDDLPRHARFKKGDSIMTSGYSSIFPPGIFAGRIVKVYNSADGLSYRAKIKLSTDFGNLRDVCIIDNSRMKEQLELMRAAEDSIKPQTK